MGEIHVHVHVIDSIKDGYKFPRIIYVTIFRFQEETNKRKYFGKIQVMDNIKDVCKYPKIIHVTRFRFQEEKNCHHLQ